MSKPIVVRINAVPDGHPEVEVRHAPQGYDLFKGQEIASPGVESGGLITLFEVDRAGLVPEWGGRFVVPEAPTSRRSAVNIVWITHDHDRFGNGDLQVGFNCAHPGIFYMNPGLPKPGGGNYNNDEDLGSVADHWFQVFAHELLIVEFKPHAHRLKVPV